MRTIGNHGLSCPDPQDYAAVALYMQKLGNQIDEQLSTQLAALEGFANRPTAILTNPANVNLPPSSDSLSVFTSFLFNNSPDMIKTQVAGSTTYLTLGDPVGTVNPVTYPRGAWRFGVTLRMQPTGATDAGTGRSVFLTIRDDIAGTTVHGVGDNTYATTVSNIAELNLVTTELLAGTHGIRVTTIVAQQNISSSVNVLAGGLLWVTYEGPTDIIEVA